MNHDVRTRLRELLAEYAEWAKTADRSEAGWQSDFTPYFDILRLAEDLMRASLSTPVNEATIRDLAAVWSMSEEVQAMQEAALTIGEALGPTLARVYNAGDADARWQVVQVADRFPALGMSLVRRSVADESPIVRQFAWNAWAAIDPAAARAAAEEAARSEPDPHLQRHLAMHTIGRQGALRRMLLVCAEILRKDPDFLARRWLDKSIGTAAHDAVVAFAERGDPSVPLPELVLDAVGDRNFHTELCPPACFAADAVGLAIWIRSEEEHGTTSRQDPDDMIADWIRASLRTTVHLGPPVLARKLLDVFAAPGTTPDGQLLRRMRRYAAGLGG